MTTYRQSNSCKRCVLSQICEIKKSKGEPCKYAKFAYTERKPKV